jgi:hypothetical protein
MTGLKRISDQIKFQRKVERVVKSLDIDDPLVCHDSKDMKDDEYEDDGSLHIQRAGVRYVFDVSDGQSATGEEQNRQTRAIMEALNMKRKITDRVLVEEGDENNDAEHECNCEYCTRNW